MKIAVITPYCREDDAVFRACLESVRAQTWKQCTHFLVADGFPNPIVGEGNNRHVVLPSAHGDNGNIGRCIGGMLARAEGFDGIAFLDADNTSSGL